MRDITLNGAFTLLGICVMATAEIGLLVRCALDDLLGTQSGICIVATACIGGIISAALCLVYPPGTRS
jgi:Na+/phosphate symporter